MPCQPILPQSFKDSFTSVHSGLAIYPFSLASVALGITDLFLLFLYQFLMPFNLVYKYIFIFKHMFDANELFKIQG